MSVCSSTHIHSAILPSKARELVREPDAISKRFTLALKEGFHVRYLIPISRARLLLFIYLNNNNNNNNNNKLYKKLHSLSFTCGY